MTQPVPLNERTTFQAEANKLMIACAFLADVELDALVNSVTRAHTLGPILDPTAYQQAIHAGSMDDVARLAKLARTLVTEYEKTK